MSHSFVAVLVVVSLGWPAVARAQESPGWRVSGGGGIGTTVYRGDDAERGSTTGVARLGLERVTGAGLGLAVEWIGAWLSGDFGGESRHHLGVTGSVDLGNSPVRGRVGLGLGLATVVETEGPPPVGGPPGDLSVGIGTYGSVDGLAGVEGPIRIGGAVELVPAAEFLVQRAGGATLLTFVATARLRVGG